ncbi:uncharacterized protein LOC111639496 [Centruroides sculpturatus]|uniref:uncharacterized protein LOC111639496 n=1 Tax=Centruroides sculpturatus TaxID=218467 RepID=UPI000C6EB7B4|nr:uncharacterized protein LOC111639496 [Centruroides sculpturatus]
MITTSNFLCSEVFLVYENEAFYAKIVFLGLAVYVALQFSILKRRKISIHYLKSQYDGEEDFVDRSERYMFIFFAFFSFILICIFAMFSFVSYFSVARVINDNKVILYCTFIIQLWLTYTSSQISFVLLSFAFGSILLGKRFVEVSKELENTNRATKAFLQNLMEKILKLWEFFQEVNENWSILFPVIYIHFVYESCFFLFGSLFAKINVILRISVFVTALILLIGSLLVSWALSKFTSIVYDNFISIGKFYSEPLSLEYKFKVIGFMKKFGGRPFGISVGGFFYVKKNFPIRVMSGLYSVFSTLIQLTGVLRRKSCTSRINENVVITNTTVH